MTFLAVEKRIASSLRERVQATADTINADDVRTIANRRQSGHWASLTVAGSMDAPRQALHAVYDALVAAADFYALRNLHKSGFDYPDAASMYGAYESELYRFDQLYRHFCESADTAEAAGWSILKPLRADVEAHYINWYLTNLALAWGKFIELHGGLLTQWHIINVPNQQRFFEKQVQPWLKEGDNRRAFVIISDAFRYEAAHELTTELNGKYRFEATLSSRNLACCRPVHALWAWPVCCRTEYFNSTPTKGPTSWWTARIRASLAKIADEILPNRWRVWPASTPHTS